MCSLHNRIVEVDGAGQALESNHTNFYILVLCTLTDHLNSVGDTDSGLWAKLSYSQYSFILALMSRARKDVENQFSIFKAPMHY